MTNSICVYLSARKGNLDILEKEVLVLAEELVKRNLSLVYGGSSFGLMGKLAKRVKDLGGKVIGVITESLLDEENEQAEIDTLYVVKEMQERKRLMQKMASLFVVVPGGLGTFEEVFETLNGKKLGLHNKNIGFLNVGGYFDKFNELLDNCIEHGFLDQENVPRHCIAKNSKDLLKEMIEGKAAK